MDINKVTLIGRLTGKPESTLTASGQRIATFTVSTNYQWRDSTTKKRKEQINSHRVVVWGKLADIAATYLAKGSRVYIEGRLSYQKFNDRKGVEHVRADVLADEIIMLGKHGAERKSPASGEAASSSASS
jgi:single-strand DNA-binding protein